MPTKKKDILATGQVVYKTSADAPPSFKQRVSQSKVDTTNYYTNLKKINQIAKELSPDGKLYGNFQKQAASLFSDFTLKKDDLKNKNFKKSLIKDIDAFIKKTKNNDRINKLKNKYNMRKTRVTRRKKT